MKRYVTALFFCLAPVFGAGAQVTVGLPTVVTQPINGGQIDRISGESAVSPNADIIAFSSQLNNLVQTATGEGEDVFVSVAGSIQVISKSFSGGATDGLSTSAAISPQLPDKTFGVAFMSRASNLVEGYKVPINPICTNGCSQIYLRISSINKTVLVSRGLGATGKPDPLLGSEGNNLHPSVTVVQGANPKYLVSFISDANNLVARNGTARTFAPYIAVVSVAGGVATVSSLETPYSIPPDADVVNAVLSGDGSRMAFSSAASNIIPEFGSNQKKQVFVYTLPTKETALISSAGIGALGDGDSFQPSLSFNGDTVAFVTEANNLFDKASTRIKSIFLKRSKSDDVFSQINTASDGTASNADVLDGRISQNGLYAAFADNGTNLTSLGNAFGFAEQAYIKSLTDGSVAVASRNASNETGDRRSFACSIGANGYSSSGVIMSFNTFATNSVAGLDGSFEPVLRADSTAPAPPLTSQTRLDAPPDVAVKKSTVTIVLQTFSSGGTPASSEGSVASSKVKYDVEIKKNGTRDRIVQTTTRNRITVRKLSPGRYTVRYRVTGKVPSGTVKTPYSPKQPFVIQK